MSYAPRLKEMYKKEVIPSLQKQFNYKSSMQVPKITKIVINQGLGDAVADKKLVESAIKELPRNRIQAEVMYPTSLNKSSMSDQILD